MNKPPISSTRVLAAALVALTLGACSKPGDDTRSSGQKLDQGIAQVERETEALKADALRGAAEAKQVAGAAMRDAKSKASEVGAQVGAELSDASIVTSVKAKLAADSMLSLSNISVESSQGHVQLRGTAADARAVDRAAQIAGAVTGVTKVDNGLTVKR